MDASIIIYKPTLPHCHLYSDIKANYHIKLVLVELVQRKPTAIKYFATKWARMHLLIDANQLRVIKYV